MVEHNPDKYCILIPDGDNHFAISVLRGLGLSRRFRTVVLGRSRFPPVRFSKFCHHFLQIPKEIPAGSQQLVDFTIQAAMKWKVDAILPTHHAIPFLGAHRSTFETAGIPLAPTPSSNAYNIAINKHSFSTFLKGNDLPHPKTFDCSEPELLEETDLEFPVLYKPKQSSNGIGIQRFHEWPSLKKHIQQSNRTAVVQQEIPGNDIDCNLFALDGKILAATVQAPLLSSKHEFRAADMIEFIEDEKVLEASADLVAKLNWSGILHIDLRYNQNRDALYFIELNPRFWGSLLGSVSAGVNFPEIVCDYTLQEQVNSLRFRPLVQYSGLKGTFRQFCHPIRNRRALIELKYSQVSYVIADPFPEFNELFRKILRLR